MKYYSEVTKKLYDTKDELTKAETAVAKAEEERKAALIQKQKEQAELKEKRAARAEEIEAAIKERDAAQKKVNELINKFTQDYGSWHYTWKSSYGDTDGDNVIKTFFRFF